MVVTVRLVTDPRLPPPPPTPSRPLPLSWDDSRRPWPLWWNKDAKKYLPACMPTYLPSCLPTYPPAYLPTLLPTYRHYHLHLHLFRSVADCWGTTGDFTTNFLHSSRFSAFRSVVFHSRPVHSLILSSHRFLCLPLHLPPCTVPCRTVSAQSLIMLECN